MGRVAATLDEVARKAGVSRATASRAINGEANVSRRSREAVAKAVRSLGYSPNRAAQTLAGKGTHAVALLVPEPSSFALSDPFIGAVINGASLALADTDLQLLLVISQPLAPSAKTERFLNSKNVGGVIVASHHSNGVMEQMLRESGLPAVFVGRPGAPSDAVAYVDLDNRMAGELACRHLLDKGRRRIATITGPADMTAVEDRLEGWRSALVAAGYEPGPVEHAFDFQTGAEQAMERILQRDPGVDGVFAQSDLLAIGAMRTLAAAGRRVPDDVAVVGVDNFSAATSATPQLTTVDNPAAELAAQAAAMLLRELENPAGPTPEPVIVPPVLIVRQSA